MALSEATLGALADTIIEIRKKQVEGQLKKTVGVDYGYISSLKKQKKGKKTHAQQKVIVKKAKAVMEANEKASITKEKTEQGYDLHIPYRSDSIPEFRTGYGFRVKKGGSTTNWDRVDAFVGAGSVEKAVTKGIWRWAEETGYVVEIRADYSEDE